MAEETKTQWPESEPETPAERKLTEEEEAKLAAAKPETEVEAFAALGEVCETCNHNLQGVCQRGGIGKLRPVKPTGHCSLWG